MNFRGWVYQFINTRCLERTFTSKKDDTRLRCDFHFLGLGCVHDQATPPPTLSLRIYRPVHKEIEDLEFDSLWVTKMKWGDAY